MRPAFDLNATDPSAFQTLLDMLNRAGFLSHSAVARIDLQTWQQTDAVREDTRYISLHWPMDSGFVLRSVRLHPSFDLPHSTSRSSRFRIAAGIRRGSSFDVLGTEFDSRAHDLVEGVARDLVTREAAVPVLSGVAVRVTQVGWPPASVGGLDVEAVFGFQG